MSLGKRLFIGEAAADAACPTDTVDIFGDSSGVALYSLDYDASDAGGNHNGTVSGGVTFGVDGQINWGASFDGGSSTQIEIPDNDVFSPVTNDFSASMWVKPTSGHVMSKQGEWHIRTYGGGADGFVEFWLFRSGGGSTHSRVLVAYNTGITDGDWHHLVVTADYLSSYKIYLDGVKIGENTSGFSGTMLNTSNPVRIGSNGTATTERYLGDLDQVRFFKKSLSQSDVDTLYAETACVYTPTTDNNDYPVTNAAYYKLDNNALDETTNYDGTEYNITYEFGRYGTAAVFNGSSSYIQTALSTTFGAISHSLWFYADSADSTNFLYHFTNRSGRVDVAIIGGVAGTGSNSISASSESVSITATTATSQFNHLLLVYTGWASSYSAGYYGSAITVTAYLNGSSIGTASPTPYGQATGMRIGRSGGSYYFEGKIDQVRVFDSALDATAAENLYNEKQAYITKDGSDPFGDDSEVAFYKMENNANDSTGSNNGADSNVTFTSGSGLFGTYAANFNGSSSYIETGIDHSSLSALSYSFWFKQNSSTGNSRIFGGVNAGVTNSGMFRVREDNDQINYYSINNTAYTFSKGLTDGVWHHIALTDNGSTGVKLYVDGLNITSPTSSSSTTSTNTNLQIGRGRNNGGTISDYTNGSLDQVRIFDRALDGDEVFKLYAEVIN